MELFCIPGLAQAEHGVIDSQMLSKSLGSPLSQLILLSVLFPGTADRPARALTMHVQTLFSSSLPAFHLLLGL